MKKTKTVSWFNWQINLCFKKAKGYMNVWIKVQVNLCLKNYSAIIL